MIEFTVPLSLPLRAVVLAGEGSATPRWVNEEFARLPQIVAARRTASAKAAILARQQQDLAELRQQRDAWKRGLTELQRAVVRADGQCGAILSELRESAVELALAIASKLVFHQLAAGSFSLDRMVDEVLGRLNPREPAIVRLHPEDLAALQREGGFEPSADSERAVRLIADSKLSRGDCQADAGEITVVYELNRQIDEIRRELLSTVTGHAEPGP